MPDPSVELTCPGEPVHARACQMSGAVK